MDSTKDFIDREAHKTSKGFRLQKLRAVELMIESEKMPENTVMFWATEYLEDVFQNNEGETLIEEDKDYNAQSSFTFNSSEIKKTLVSFIDVWIHYEYSELIKFNFYSSNKIGKERKTDSISDLGIELPDVAMITLAQETSFEKYLLRRQKNFS